MFFRLNVAPTIIPTTVLNGKVLFAIFAIGIMFPCLAKDTTSSIAEKLQNTPYACATDGSNDVNTQLYPLVIRYFNKDIDKIMTALPSDIMKLTKTLLCSLTTRDRTRNGYIVFYYR
jgi:hypothetical protein